MTHHETHPSNEHISLTFDGKVRSHSSVGGYPMFYFTQAGTVLSAMAVEENLELCTDPEEPLYFIVGAGVNWEDTHLYCDVTGQRIESAYGDEDEDEDEDEGGGAS